MKIAYIFSGHSRTWEQCHNNFFNNIYNILPGDIFIHTWDRVNAGTTSWWNVWNRKGGMNSTRRLKPASEKIADIEGIKARYNPKHIIVEKDPSWDEIPHQWARPKYESHPQWDHVQTTPRFGAKYILYAFKTIFDIAKEYDNYDRFFCSRLDINFLSALDLIELENPNLVLSQTKVSYEDFRQDIFFHGTKNLVELRSEYYNHIEEYWYDKDYITLEFEHALTNYLKDKNIPISESNLRFNIPRINGKTSEFQ